MTPENREYILTLISDGLSRDDMRSKMSVGCDCRSCLAIDEYFSWVYIGEYTQDYAEDDAEEHIVPPVKKHRLVTFDSMYFKKIPALWYAHQSARLTTENFYKLNSALILCESSPRQGRHDLHNILGIVDTTHAKLPLRGAPLQPVPPIVGDVPIRALNLVMLN